jgi:hypothetical protein
MDRRSVFGCAVAACVTWLPVSAASSAGSSLAVTTESDGGTFKVELEPSASPVPVNELFELEVMVTVLRVLDDPNPLWLDLQTSMPGHGHGMNTRARVEPLGDGRFIVRGLLLHMAGQWDFTFDVAKGRVHEKAAVSFELK